VPTGGAARLSIGASKASTAEAPKALPPSLQKPRQVVKKRKFEAKSLLPIIGIVLILGAAGYFGWPYVVKMQDKANAATTEAAKNSDGGQVGHIMELNSVLDATDPNRRSESGREGLPNRQSTGARAIASANEAVSGVSAASSGDPTQPGQTAAPEKPAPVIPPVHTLDLAAAKIPAGKVNGTISGTNFLSETARIDQVGASKVLRFVQGALASPDREVMVYLRMKATDSLTNYTVEVSADKRGTTIPTVVKRWKTNPRYAPQSKTFNSGYALKLEIKQTEDGTASGKVFVALPDNEQTVIAGNFTATVNLAGAGAMAPVAAPAPVPAAGGMSPAERQLMQQRYGISQ
jgi:hypothetical protein